MDVKYLKTQPSLQMLYNIYMKCIYFIFKLVLQYVTYLYTHDGKWNSFLFFRRQVFIHTPKLVKLTEMFYVFVYSMI